MAKQSPEGILKCTCGHKWGVALPIGVAEAVWHEGCLYKSELRSISEVS